MSRRIDGRGGAPGPEGDGGDTEPGQSGTQRPLSGHPSSSSPDPRLVDLASLPQATRGDLSKPAGAGANRPGVPVPGGTLVEREAALHERFMSGDPNVRSILTGTQSIDIAPGESKQIFIFGMTDGMALAIVSKREDGRRCCTLSRYSESAIDEQTLKLYTELDRHWPLDASVKHEMLFVVAGLRPPTPGGSRIVEAKRKYDDDIKKLTGVVRARLYGIQPKILPFMPFKVSPRSSSTMFALYVPDKTYQRVRYEGIVDGACEF